MSPAQGDQAAPILEARALTKQFGGFKAVNDVSLSVCAGTIHSIIGPNGAGKTTLFHLLTRFLSPTAGSIHFHGKDITRLRPAAVSRLGLVRSFQISAVFPHLSVRDNIGLALQRAGGQSFKFWRHESCLAVERPQTEALAETFQLSDVLDTLAGELPYGRKRALELATTLALDPQIMLLDEPMAGLASGEIEKTAQIIRRSAEGRTVVMIEHNLSVVASISDRITVLTRGRVLTEGTYAEVAGNAEVMEAYMGLADG